MRSTLDDIFSFPKVRDRWWGPKEATVSHGDESEERASVAKNQSLGSMSGYNFGLEKWRWVRSRKGGDRMK